MKKKNKSIHILIAAAIFFVMNYILKGCTDLGITAAGAGALSLFISTIYLWLTYGTGWTSMASIALLPLTGICTNSVAMANSFGNSTVIIVVGALILCAALEENGVMQLVANWFITRKVVNKRPYMFLFMFLLANLVICWFMNPTAVMVLFVALARETLESLGFDKNDKFSKSLYLGVLWICSVGNGATPIGHSVPLLMLNSFAKIAGEPVSWVKYMIVGIPLSLVTLGLTMLIIKFGIRPDCSKYANYDIEERRKNLGKLTKKGKICVAVYVALIIAWLAPDILKNVFPSFVGVLNKIGSSLIALVAVCILAAVHVDGEPVLNYDKAVRSISWSTCIFIACIFLYASAFNMADGGINVFLQNLVRPLTSTMSPAALAALFLAFVIFVTNFASNGVTGTVGIVVGATALYALLPSNEVYAYATLVAILCNMGIATPGGSGFVAIAQKDDTINGKETLGWSMLLIVLMYALTMFVFWPLAKVVF